MSLTAVIGAQFGDEGKGKVTDFLSEDADWVVRCQGGPNAGHSVIVDGKSFILHQIPTGILHKKCHAVSGSGMVISPEGIIDEISKLKEVGLFRGELLISERANVILPLHRAIDEWEERTRGGEPTGTTLRGIGPAYEDRVGRWGIRMADLLRPDILRTRLEGLYRARAHIKEKKDSQSLDELVASLEKAGKTLKPYICATEPELWKAVANGDKIVLEGAQGNALDVDFGIYPFTTSSHTTVAGTFTGSGIPPQTLDSVVGITKAYATRVGNGPFPTELDNDVGERIRERGGERGATTGRPRRCGWLDLVFLRYAIRLNGITSLAMTKIDVLGGESEIKVAAKYKGSDGEIVRDYLPTIADDFSKLTPVYDKFPGWPEFTEEVRQRLSREGYRALPQEARNFIVYVEKETGVGVSLISYGPAREDTILPGDRTGTMRGWSPSVST